MSNYPLAFGELLAGAILIDKGVAAFKDALSTPAATAATTDTLTGTTGLTTGSSSGSAALPSGASGRLNANQQAFASRLAADTGLDAGVVAAWVTAEEPASAAQAPNGANNWLNIGDTGSGNYGGGSSVWASPVTAADETAQWLAGKSLPGYGPASAGVQSILATAGQSAQAQIQAIQGSGWASSGYPDLLSIYQSIAG